ncbi:hypothetical protein KKG22_06030 [Patescibacteria group bacterium]|nr:hypothetical protein [Patescibacteria group bacterium]MBU1932087.1 hypothetical protein [Patescibacteria group bacterium]
MTTQETKVSAVDRDALDAERNTILNAYCIQFDVWKVQNDNYFKRVQILMVVIQAALFTAALRFIPPKSESWCEIFIPMVIAVLGIFSAHHWTSLNEKQNQYMEFCRRTLRNLESRLVELGVPLRYFTLEAHVFGPLRTEITNSAGTSMRTKGDRHVAHFAWSTEDYPDPDEKEDNIHELRKVGDGMMICEKKIAWGVLCVWALGLILLTVTVIMRGVCP